MKKLCYALLALLAVMIIVTGCKKNEGNITDDPITPMEVNETIDENGNIIIETTLSDGKMYFRLLSDNEAEVVGRAAFYDEEHIGQGYLYKGNVTIPSSISYTTRNTYTITSVDGCAFSGCSELVTVEMPSTIASIGEKAFLDCVHLTTVTVHPNLPPRCDATIFNGCTALQMILVPDDNLAQYQSAIGWINYRDIIQGIDGGSGGGSSQDPIIVSTQEIVNGSTVVVEANFEDGSRMYFAILSPTTAAVVNRSWFYINGNESQGWAYRGDIIIPGTITHLGTNYSIVEISSNAFSSCPLITSLNMPNSITSIFGRAFSGCSNMTRLVLSSSLTTIETEAFSGCSSLMELALPNSITTIGSRAFAGCSSITHVTLTCPLTKIENGTFSGCSGLTELILPNSLQQIGSYAFSGCSGLTELTLPSTMQSIGSYAFSGTNLESVTIPSLVQTIGECAFNVENVFFNAENCSDGYYNRGCFTGVKQIIFSDNVTRVPSFLCCDNSELISVAFSNSITEIGEGAFKECSSLSSIDIPISVIKIGTHDMESHDGAFQNCTSLTTVAFGENSILDIGEKTFFGCTGLQSVYFANTRASIGPSVFYDCTNLTTVELGDSVSFIGPRAFYNCSNLTSIVIPNSTVMLGIYAFYGCTNLNTVVLSESLWDIPSWAFCNCRSLTSVVIPDSVNYIEDHSFEGCVSLNSVTIGNQVVAVGDVFKDCSSLESVVIGQSVESISKNVFDGCNNLSEITCLAAFPPAFYSNYSTQPVPFYGCPIQIIYVPVASVEDYKHANGWCYFENRILGI